MANCPNCKESGMLLALYKCKKCGSVVCDKCKTRSLGFIRCPFCSGEVKRI